MFKLSSVRALSNFMPLSDPIQLNKIRSINAYLISSSMILYYTCGTSLCKREGGFSRVRTEHQDLHLFRPSCNEPPMFALSRRITGTGVQYYYFSRSTLDVLRRWSYSKSEVNDARILIRSIQLIIDSDGYWFR